MSLAIQPYMHPDYDALINPGDEKDSESVSGGYVGNEEAKRNRGTAYEKLNNLLSEGKTFDDPDVQKAFYEVLYWDEMISAANKHGEKELMKDSPKAMYQHAAANSNAIASMNKLCSLNNLHACTTGTGASQAIKQGISDLESNGLGAYKSQYLSMLKNKGDNRITELEAKVSNNTATDAEKEELKNLKGTMAVLDKYIEGNGATSLSDKELNDVFTGDSGSGSGSGSEAMSFDKSVSVFQAHRKWLDTAFQGEGGSPDALFSKEDLEAVLKDPSAPPALKEACKYMLDNPAEFSKLDTMKEGGKIDGLVSFADLDVATYKAMSYEDAVKTISLNRTYLDTAGTGGSPDKFIDKKNLEAAMNDPKASPELRAACKYMLENPEKFKNLETAKEGGQADDLVSFADLDAAVASSGSKGSGSSGKSGGCKGSGSSGKSGTYGKVSELKISEYDDALCGEGTNTKGYVGNTVANQRVTEAKNEIQELEAQGKTDDDPEMQQANFKLAYWEKMIEYAGMFGEEELKNDPELAKTLHNAALADAKGSIIISMAGSSGSGRTGSCNTGTRKSDAGARKECDKLSNMPGTISGDDMYKAIVRGTEDVDNNLFAGEFNEFLNFACENWDRMSPEAKKVFLTYQNAALDAQSRGETGATTEDLLELYSYMKFAAEGDGSTGEDGYTIPPRPSNSYGPKRYNKINPQEGYYGKGGEYEDGEYPDGEYSSGSGAGTRSGRTGYSSGGLEYEGRIYASAFQYAEAIFADIAYLMQDLLKTKVDELKKMKDEVAEANEVLAMLNGAQKDGSKGRNIIKVTENASAAEAAQAQQEGRWNTTTPEGFKYGEAGTSRVESQKAKKLSEFCKKELNMDVDPHYITNEDYEKLKTKLESYISSRQTDMQKLSTDIQSIKDKFDQMWRLVGGLISMEGDLNKALVGNIR